MNWLYFMKMGLSLLLKTCRSYGMSLVGTRYLHACLIDLVIRVGWTFTADLA